jgi:NADPH-dependent 2,4-dienoyl-CoA reductase/sulfur reductase-like enzyme
MTTNSGQALADLPETWDVAVIGAGPAGMSAATVAAHAGLSTVLIDENPGPGGQIYRGISASPITDRSILGEDYWKGRDVLNGFLGSGAVYCPRTTAWSLSRERSIGVSSGGMARMLQARRVVIATGALERPMPIPGWTLPGVMTAGAAQTMLKSSALVPTGRIVLAGCGPLLWLLASQLLAAGATIAAVLETTDRAAWKKALPLAPQFAMSPYLSKGLRLMRSVQRRVRVVTRVTQIEAKGQHHLSEVVFATSRGPQERLAADLLLLHQGVVPNHNLAMAAGVEHRWNEDQLCWTPVLADDGSTSLDGIALAGDGAGIAGAEAAAERGKLAGLAAARALAPTALVGLPDEQSIRSRLARYLRGRRFLDLLYQPPEQFRRPQGDTIVCRCEEITASQIVATVPIGAIGPNQMKSFLRCGMGPCQGRLCNLTVTELIAATRGVSPAEVGTYRLRPPVKPLSLSELAAMPKSESAVKAVVRG